MFSEAFPGKPFDTVSVDCLANAAPGDRQSEPRTAEVIPAGQYQQAAITRLAGAIEDALELARLREPDGGRKSSGTCFLWLAQALRTARPLARRAFRTRRPPLVFMRARKPWRRLRLILLG